MQMLFKDAQICFSECKERGGESLLFFWDCWWEQDKSLKTVFTIAWLVAPCHLILEANYTEITIHTGCTQGKRVMGTDTKSHLICTPRPPPPPPPLLPPRSTRSLEVSQSTYMSITLLKWAAHAGWHYASLSVQADFNLKQRRMSGDQSCKKTSVSRELDGVKRIWSSDPWAPSRREDIKKHNQGASAVPRGVFLENVFMSWAGCAWSPSSTLPGLLVNERSGTIWPHHRVGEAFFYLLLRNNKPSAVLLEKHTWHWTRWRLPTSSDVNGRRKTIEQIFHLFYFYIYCIYSIYSVLFLPLLYHTPVIFFSCLISDCTVLILFGNLYLIFLLK